MKALIGFISVVFGFSSLLYVVWTMAPELEGVEKPSFPKDMENLRQLANIMIVYRDLHLYYTILLFSLAFLFKQTFAIPGSFFMNLLAGAMFGGWMGSLLSCLLTATGASMCYIVSALFARPLVTRFFHHRLNSIRLTLASERDRLFFFLLSARVFPLTPHWLLNISSPFLGIPLRVHFATVAIGLIPYNVLCVRAGCVLSEIRSWSDVFDTMTLLELLFITTILVMVAKYAKRTQNSSSTTQLPS